MQQLVSLLRTSIQGGIGPMAFRQMIQSFHYEQFDRLHEQYLHLVHDCFKGCPSHFWTKKEGFSTFGDQSGYAGSVPSGPYFAWFYAMLVERDTPKLKQCIALLPACTLAIDHSFKVVKHLGKVGGAALFTALHTTVNDYGEIWSMLFTMTKGHDQFMPNMHEIAHSLTKFGHGDVEAVFMDNGCADKEEVQHAFPSLFKGVVHLSTTMQVNLRFDIIMNHRTTDNPLATAALGLQWPVDISTGVQGLVALIEVAYQQTVYLIPTSLFIQRGHINLPHSLLAFLWSPFFKKVGNNIGADLKWLYRDCGFAEFSPPFAGSVELDSMAKEHGAAAKWNVSLADLVSSQLCAYLPKNQQIQVSPQWANTPLPQEFIDHAVLDIYAISEVHQQLLGLQVAQPITSKSSGGTPVAWLATDGREVAHGIVALERPQALNGVNLTSTRVAVTISKIIVPSFLLPPSLSPSKHSVPLSYGDGAQPAWSIHLKCHHCHTNYHNNFSVNGSTRTYYGGVPQYIQVGEHQFAEEKLILHWIDLMLNAYGPF
ncbi:hypothetical protein L210DRAFT_3650237 [Boletus edulis BED1]|uniref:Uncharacterized protein n=1 Tax=Boletus edulis BED1 TaxID=1328754 RepID=A0AAD4BKC5_BOLED|nr:hypothetical protein L210DRAFT_3650237 [Boletus edulis BED1]